MVRSVIIHDGIRSSAQNGQSSRIYVRMEISSQNQNYSNDTRNLLGCWPHVIKLQVAGRGVGADGLEVDDGFFHGVFLRCCSDGTLN